MAVWTMRHWVVGTVVDSLAMASQPPHGAGRGVKSALRESHWGAAPHAHNAGVQTVVFSSSPGMRSIHRHKGHLCGWIERIPGGTREHDGLDTGIVGVLLPRDELDTICGRAVRCGAV